MSPSAPTDVEAARRIVASYVVHYNEVRLHSASCYITPAKPSGREREIFNARDRKLEAARQRRRYDQAARR